MQCVHFAERETISDLTGSAPEKHAESTAGLTHTWKLTTSYYSVDIPIWIDEIAHAGEWKADFLKPDAKEVIQVVGAWIFCFRKPLTDNELVRILILLSKSKVQRSQYRYIADHVDRTKLKIYFLRSTRSSSLVTATIGTECS